MPNPYRDRPVHSFWRSAVAAAPDDTDPVVAPAFTIAPTDAVATAGSCFAQHIGQALRARGFAPLLTERFAAKPGTADEGYGVFPARFGNLYTARQLLQLFDRAYGLRVPRATWWRRADGAFLDPFRPRIQASGFANAALLQADRERHLAAVRSMLERCRVFVFTLGLTESWAAAADGFVVPLPPGVVAEEVPEGEYRFHNQSVAEVVADLDAFLGRLATVNPTARVILTVSPVPLVATYEDRHVLVSTIASKSILRAAADEICRRHERVAYFPAYEIITGPQARGRYLGPDLREVNEEGVARVMALFARHYLVGAPEPAVAAAPPATAAAPPDATALSPADAARLAAVAAVICDEEAIEP